MRMQVYTRIRLYIIVAFVYMHIYIGNKLTFFIIEAQQFRLRHIQTFVYVVHMTNYDDRMYIVCGMYVQKH